MGEDQVIYPGALFHDTLPTMPYCPDCGAEYQAGIEKCIDCEVALVDKPPAEEPMVEVFQCSDLATAQRISAVVLDELRTFIRTRSNSAFPTPGVGGQELIAVEARDAARARQLLTEAFEDGAITGQDGAIIAEG
jgi:hypothetical protein